MGALGLVAALLAGAAACGAVDEQTTTAPSTDNVFRPTQRSATTRRTVSKEASDEFDKAIAAARASTTSGTGRSSSTKASTTTTSTRASSSSSTAGGGASPSVTPSSAERRLTAEECQLFAQLIAFVDSLDPLIDVNDAEATAARVADPVARSKAGLDQLLSVAPSAVRGDAAAVVAWLRALAAGGETDHAKAKASFDAVRSWSDTNCAG